MDTPRVALLIFLLIFLFMAPDPQRSTPHQQLQLDRLLESEHHALDVLNATRFGDFDPLNKKWINITGLKEEDGYAWELLPKVQTRAREQLDLILQPWRKAEAGSWESGSFLGSRYDSVETADGGLPVASNKTMQETLHVPFFQNVTGLLHGKWIRSRVAEGYKAPELNLTALSPLKRYVTREYNRNITGQEGGLKIRLDETNSERYISDRSSVREIKAEMTIKDITSNGDGWDLTLHGLHFPESGGVLLTTSGDKFGGIFTLPHFVRSESMYYLAQQLLNRTIMSSIIQQESSALLNPSFPWSSSPNNPADVMFPVPHCEYIVYLQQHVPLVSGRTSDEVRQHINGIPALEQELRYPTGAALAFVPDMTMSAIIFSPDCGFVLESKGPPDFPQQGEAHLEGPKTELYLTFVKRFIITFALILIAQIYLIMRQMKDTSTPSTRSRVSFYSIAIMAMGDGCAWIGLGSYSMLYEPIRLLAAATAFLAFLCVSFFGMKFLMDIWAVQEPERRERERRLAASNPPPRPTEAVAPMLAITPAGADTLPLPATARRPLVDGATPVILPPDQDLTAAEAEEATPNNQVPAQTTLGSARREAGALYSRFYFLLMGISFLSLHATTWPNTIRSIYINIFVFTYFSLWVPQIYRNIIRNCRKALRWEFVLGQSVLRLAPCIYVYTATDNIFFSETDQYTAYTFVGWVWFQILVLASHEILGPRFMIPDSWAPPAYDYHPILREDDEEAGSTMPIGFTQTSPISPKSSSSIFVPGESKSKGHRTFDCAICMQTLDVPVILSSGSDADTNTPRTINLFTRRAYMVTPCRHIFHSTCLEGWMRLRLQCPICRENLPPL